ncbi:gastrula zinc finger protein XlCGF57.1-like [Boleophthalmus pectinirostris]|uniref:gastrula zinc finger protein XlCGF57.1-like n=1 Tax=Boleophthalmus pectinirostris TaxID=150288 RepID=UPI00242CA5CB|nr:gastrula zinc finger protein XlCGF57.1-like [Boleophthalmus pectinirostris]
MSEKTRALRALVTQRLSAAADEIFALVERTIAEYEEELRRSKEETHRNQRNQRNQQNLDSDLSPQLRLHRTADAQVQTYLEMGNFSPQMKDYSEILGEDFNCTVKNESEEQSEEEEEEWAQANSSAQPPHDGNHYSHVQTEGAAGLFPSFKFGDFSMNKSPTATSSDFCAVEDDGIKHQCHFCEKKFRDKHNLKRHITVHTGEKPFSCTVCGRCFSQKETLRQHMGLHSRSKTEPRIRRGGSPRTAPAAQDPAASPSKSAPFSCPVCARCFTRPFSLQSHMVTHTGEKPFLCLQCNMRFNRKSNLKRHAKTHAPK